MFVLSPYLDYIEQAQMADMLGIQKKALQVLLRKRYIESVGISIRIQYRLLSFIFLFRTGSETKDIVQRRGKRKTKRSFFSRMKSTATARCNSEMILPDLFYIAQSAADK